MGLLRPLVACMVALFGCALPDYQPVGAATAEQSAASSSAQGSGGASGTSSSSSGGAGGSAPACTLPDLGGTVFTVGQRCFWLSLPKRTWAAAEAECETWGGKLASIHSMFLQNAIAAEFDKEQPGRVWLAGTDSAQEGTFVWIDTGKIFYQNKMAFDYTNWGMGQPSSTPGDEDCVEMEGPVWLWNDLDCTWLAQFLCARLG